jgi:hypothetical protein
LAGASVVFSQLLLGTEKLTGYGIERQVPRLKESGAESIVFRFQRFGFQLKLRSAMLALDSNLN